MSQRNAERLIGALIILAFPFFAGGQYFFSQGQTLPGFGLIVLNSLSVFIIGVLMNRIIGPHQPAVGGAYLTARFLEAVLLAAGGAYWAFVGGEMASLVNLSTYRVAMIGLGLGSIVLFFWLYQVRWLPRAFALFGALGYACLAAAMGLDAFGMSDASMAPLLIAAVFELAFALWMIFRGYRAEGVAT